MYYSMTVFRNLGETAATFHLNDIRIVGSTDFCQKMWFIIKQIKRFHNL